MSEIFTNRVNGLSESFTLSFTLYTLADKADTGCPMPAALDVNWGAIRAHAVTHGVNAAAEHFGLSLGTVKARSARENWLEPVRQLAEKRAMQPVATSPHQAAVNGLEKLSGKSKLGLARAISKGATHLGRMKPAEIIHRTGAIRDLAAAGKATFDWGTAQPASLVIHLGSNAHEQPSTPAADPLDMLRSCAVPDHAIDRTGPDPA